MSQKTTPDNGGGGIQLCMLATPGAIHAMATPVDYQWAYFIVDSSRVSTFLISILLIVYGSD
jgi:hypothetical protein